MQKETLSEFDPVDQLKLLEIKSQQLAPKLYRDHALYLQIVRNLLRNSVRQAIFVLITDKSSGVSNLIASDSRNLFQGKVDELVSDTLSLLTVEHLMDLVRQIENENKLKIEKNRQELFMSLNNAKKQVQSAEGSVHLSFSPPLENPIYLEDWLQTEYDSDSSEFDELEEKALEADNKGYLSEESSLVTPSQSEAETDDSTNLKKKKDLDILRSLFALVGQTVSGETPANEERDEIAPENKSFHEDQPPIEKRFLPDNPIELNRWMDSFEFALTRRLCNLSHALNLELLKSGVINSLLPISLLEAVLRGQFDSQPSTSNILKLRVPVKNNVIEAGMDISCVLLRLSELEFDDPGLRRSRTQLKQHRSELIKMVRQQRHWQNRLVVKEAHQKWWQNPPKNS